MATTAAVDTHDHLEVDAGGSSEVQPRHLPLSRIVVPDGFNPRGRVEDDRELDQSCYLRGPKT